MLDWVREARDVQSEATGHKCMRCAWTKSKGAPPASFLCYCSDVAFAGTFVGRDGDALADDVDKLPYSDIGGY